jgi:hypothetical protein
MTNIVSMEDSDLRQRFVNLQDKYERLKGDYIELQSQAFALVWFIPGTTTVQEIRDTKDRMYNMLQRINSLADLQARFDALQEEYLATQKGLER